MIENLEQETRRIAIDVHGGRPDKCYGWKAKMFNAAWAGAEQGLERGYRIAQAEAIPTDIDARARQIAERVLMAKLLTINAGNRPKLKARIALVRSGRGDALPEVQAAQIALAQSTTLGQ